MSSKSSNVFFKLFAFVSIFIFALTTFAINGRTTYQARIVKPNGYPLESASVNFRFSVLDQSGSCILYVEDFSNINMTDTAGVISFPLGTGIRAFPTSGTSQTFQNTFDNSIVSFACQTVGIYNPNPTDSRKVVMQFNDGAGWQTLPAMTMNAVPYAMFATKAVNASALNGKADSAFVEVSTLAGLNCASDQAIKYNGGSFACINVGVSSTPVTSSSVVAALGYTPVNTSSFTALDTTVSTVSNTVYLVSSTVTNLNNLVTSLQNSVAASFSTIVQSQWVTSGTSISYNGDIQVSGGVRISMDVSACDSYSAGTLRYNAGLVEYCNGTIWSAFGVAGAGITLLNGSSSGTQTFGTGINGTVFNITSVNGVHTFNIPLAASASVTAGLLSNSDYTLFSNKMNATSAAVISALGYTPANSATVNSLSSLSASIASDLASVSASVNTAQNNIGAVSSTVASLSNSTAASFAALTSSQWSSNGTTINYGTGNVGIGITNPNYLLDVSGTVHANRFSANNGAFNNPAITFVNNPGTGFYNNGGSLGISVNSSLVGMFNSSSLSFNAGGAGPQIYFSGGNAAQPSYAFNVDSDTGMFNPNAGGGSNELGFSTSGVERLRIASSGLVGIGMNTPTALLNLNSGTASLAPLKIASGSLLTSPQSGTIEYDGFNFYVTNGANLRRALASVSAVGTYDNASVLSNSGNITLVPTGSVVVSATTSSSNSSTGALVVRGGLGVGENLNVAGVISGSSIVRATGYRANQAAPNGADGSTNGYAFGLDGDTGMFSPGPISGANGILAFYNNNVETMRVNPGAVGIGTTSPADPLHVIGPITTGNASNTAKITLTPDFTGSGFLQSYSSAGVFRPLAIEGQQLTFNAHGSGTTLVGGAVGINRSPSSYMLDVDGSFRTGNAGGQGGYLSYDGHADIRLGYPSRGSAITNRAIVADVGNLLTLNYNNDFGAGVRIGSSVNISSATTHILGQQQGTLTTYGSEKFALTLEQRYGSGGWGPALEFRTNDLSDTWTNAAIAAKDPVDGSYSGALAFFTTPGGAVTSVNGARTRATNLIERMRITQSGNVGVGTSAPVTKLDINGSISNTTGEFRNYIGRNITMAPVGDGTYPGYLLLAKAYTSGNVENSEIQGRFVFSRGSTASSNRTTVIEVSSKSAYQSEYFHVNSLNSFSNFVTGVFKVTYGGVVYHALGLGQTGGAAHNGVVFDGLIDNADPIIVRDVDVTSPVAYGTIGLFSTGGNVGVGTISPTRKLHVMGGDFAVSDSTYPGVYVQNTAKVNGTYGRSWAWMNYGDGFYLNGYPSSGTNISPGGPITPMYIQDTTGRVGIGTTTPGQLFEVSGTARFPALDISGSNAQTADRPYIRGTADHLVIAPAQNRTGGADANSIYLAYPGDLTGGDTVVTRIQESLFITATGAAGGGKVAVGTTTPTNKFEVVGGDSFFQGRAYVYSNSGWGAVVPSISLAIGDNDTGLNWVSDGVLQLYSNNAVRMHVTTGGAVGINRTDPSYNLDVNGTFRVSGQAYTDTGAATFTVLSDERYKNVHGQYERGLNELLKIGTVRYNYKKENPTGADSKNEYVGVLAQNVQQAIPEAVEKQNKDGQEFLTVNPSPIIFAMINGFKDMYNKIVQLVDNDARLEREIASLKEKNLELEIKAKEFDELKAYICKKDPQAPNCK